MPKINGKPVDPKAYSKRVTEAKKTLARTSPEVKRKIAEMYPKVNGKDIVNKALSPKPIKKGPKPMGPNKKKAMPAPGSDNDPVTKALKFFLGDKSKPSGKKNGPKPRGVKLPGKPVPLAEYKPNRAPGAPKPAPMPKRVPNLSLPVDQRASAKKISPGLRKKGKSPSTATPKARKPSPSNKTNYGPLPKNPTLNDYLMRGIRPPSRNKPGSRPSDADVIIKGYNDPATIKKYKKK